MEDSFGAYHDRDRALREWNELRMVQGKASEFLDKIMTLVLKLGYSDPAVIIDKIKLGLTKELRDAWALGQPHPTDPALYIDALRKVAQVMGESTNFTQTVVHKNKGNANERNDRNERRDQRGQRNSRGRGSGKFGRKPGNPGPRSSRNEAPSEYALAHKGIATTLAEKRRKEGKCSKCGQVGHFWRACPSANPVVYSANSRNPQKRKREGAEPPKESLQGPTKKMKRIEAPPSQTILEA
jgi:hypothetical protein